MTAYTHQTAPTRFIETSGIRFAYRHFGKEGVSPWCSTSTNHLFVKHATLFLDA